MRSRMPWLTTAQAEEMTRLYVEQRISLTRQTLVHHIGDLRAQYETRYRELRRTLLKRHAAITCALLAGTAGFNTAACLVGR
ncbi:hypothetical protein C1J00_32550 [Streptomyces cahuitamycinicus]|uniref:Uncharacterized protein n=1 Tax=Streptomyces cahuitamycinicus TaxID=2070367 RepID=A0A2N8TGN0_9ACTN|nr:hypothetical protein C1J00_32550 [Streptomyces cahuitamycinicus]